MSSQNLTTRIVYRRSPGPSPYSLIKSTEPITTPLPAKTLLIKIHAISLNYRDANILNGTNPWPVLEKGIPCSDAAGTVLAVGDGTTRFAPGDHVAPILDTHLLTGEEQTHSWLGGEEDGTLATHMLVDEEKCVRTPEHLSFAEAACLPNAGLTAWSSLIEEGTRRLCSGLTVLVQGTGGVSLMAVKLAVMAGATVFFTSSSDEKLEHVKKMVGGKSVVGVNYNTTPNWDEEIMRLNGGMGVDVVLEDGGTSSLMRSFRVVKRRGIVSQVGYLGKQDVQDLEGMLPLLIEKTITYRGITCGSRLDFERMNKMIETTELRFEDVIDRRYPFDAAREAISYLWSGKHVGKVVIDVD